ncbi:26875_t:CDS:2, partial [Racocetra persica]
LFAALLLHDFNEYQQKRNKKQIKIVILECQDRVGGCVYTEYFDKDYKKKLYGEFGAIRLPQTKSYTNIFETIKYLNEINGGYTEKENPHYLKLIDFIFTDERKNFLPNSVNSCYKQLFEDSLKYYFDILDYNIDDGIKELMKVNKYSVDSYLTKYLFRRMSDKNIDQTIGIIETMT